MICRHKETDEYKTRTQQRTIKIFVKYITCITEKNSYDVHKKGSVKIEEPWKTT